MLIESQHNNNYETYESMGKVDVSSITWEVIRWEWILHFIDIGFKLINFKLEKNNNKNNTHALQLVITKNSIAKS